MVFMPSKNWQLLIQALQLKKKPINKFNMNFATCFLIYLQDV